MKPDLVRRMGKEPPLSVRVTDVKVVGRMERPQKSASNVMDLSATRAVRESTKLKTTKVDKNIDQLKIKSHGEKLIPALRQIKTIFDQKELLMEALATEVCSCTSRLMLFCFQFIVMHFSVVYVGRKQ